MGTDVHMVFQKKKVIDNETVVWEDIKSEYEENRHYLLFGWLANVRNGYGFAGVITNTPFIPLSDERGFPEDFKLSAPGDGDWSNCEYHNGVKWMGYEDYGWLSGEEILNGLKNLPKITQYGVISLDKFREWDGKQKPVSYSGSITGKNIITIPMSSDAVKGNRGNYSLHLSSYLTNYRDKLIGTSRLKLRTKPSKMKLLKKLMKYQDQVNYRYVEVNWEVSSDDLKQQFSYFTDEIQRLTDLHGEIRVVFGFDS